MKQNKQPTPKNVVPGDTEGITWALPEDAIARLGKGRNPKIVLSPNSEYFAVGTMIGLWWYDMSSKSPTALWESERGLISIAEFSPNGEWIAIANWDGVIKLLDVQSGECLAQMKRMQEHNIYYHLDFSPDSIWIAVEVLDVHQGVCVAQMDRGEREVISADISQVEFSPDGRYVAATADELGTKGTQTFIWCSETGKIICKFEAMNFVFSPDSCLLAAATPDESNNDDDWLAQCVSVWNIATCERIAQFIGHDDWVDHITFSLDGKFLASSSRDESLRVWDIAEGEQKEVYTDFNSSRIIPFYTEADELLAIVDAEDLLDVWNMERSEKLSIPEVNTNSIDAALFKKDPQLVFTDIMQNRETKIGSNINLLSDLRKFNHVPQPVVFLADGKTLASTSEFRGIVLWDIETKQGHETLLEDKRITTFTVLPCGNVIAAYIQPNDNFGYVWDAKKPDETILEIKEEAQLTWKVDFTPTGNQIVVSSREGTIYKWDIANKKRLDPFVGHTEFIWSVKFSPDGKRLVSGSSDKTARVWDVETSKQIGTLPLREKSTLMNIAFSSCGKFIAGGMNKELRLWCADSFETLLLIPQTETESPYALAFSSCGNYLASGTWWQRGMEKMAIRIWDVASGENIATFWGHPTDIQSLAFSPDDTVLASGSFDGTIILWDLKPFLKLENY